LYEYAESRILAAGSGTKEVMKCCKKKCGLHELLTCHHAAMPVLICPENRRGELK
jgi:hypothetical protein